MKKITQITLAALLITSSVFFTSCKKESGPQPIKTTNNTSITNDTMYVDITFTYSAIPNNNSPMEIDYYISGLSTPIQYSQTGDLQFKIPQSDTAVFFWSQTTRNIKYTTIKNGIAKYYNQLYNVNNSGQVNINGIGVSQYSIINN
jgi:hypothetical protein